MAREGSRSRSRGRPRGRSRSRSRSRSRGRSRSEGPDDWAIFDSLPAVWERAIQRHIPDIDEEEESIIVPRLFRRKRESLCSLFNDPRSQLKKVHFDSLDIHLIITLLSEGAIAKTERNMACLESLKNNHRRHTDRMCSERVIAKWVSRLVDAIYLADNGHDKADLRRRVDPLFSKAPSKRGLEIAQTYIKTLAGEPFISGRVDWCIIASRYDRSTLAECCRLALAIVVNSAGDERV